MSPVTGTSIPGTSTPGLIPSLPAGTPNDPPADWRVTREAPLNPKWPEYGARGDGVTDDSAALQSCINAAKGGEILMQNGVYFVKKQLVLPAQTKLKGVNKETTVIKSEGNIYTLGVEGSGVDVSGVYLQTVAEQAEGGGLTVNKEATLIKVADCYFGSNLAITLNLAGFPLGMITLEDLRWRQVGGLKGLKRGIVIGDGVNHVVGVFANNITGEAQTVGSMKVWLDVNYADTLDFMDCLFQTGEIGLRVGQLGEAASLITGLKLHNVTWDTMSNIGVTASKYRDLELNGCNVQSSAEASSGPGVQLEGNGGRLLGGCYQHNWAGGVLIGANATHTDLNGLMVADNNMGNLANKSGMEVAAKAIEWAVRNCRSGNYLTNLNGHQKWGLLVSAECNKYLIVNNRYPGNVTAAMSNASEAAAEKVIASNL